MPKPAGSSTGDADRPGPTRLDPAGEPHPDDGRPRLCPTRRPARATRRGSTAGRAPAVVGGGAALPLAVAAAVRWWPADDRYRTATPSVVATTAGPAAATSTSSPAGSSAASATVGWPAAATTAATTAAAGTRPPTPRRPGPTTRPSSTSARVAVRFYSRISTEDLQDRLSSRRWQRDIADDVVAGHGTIVAE
jgi:hypothetical protein